MVRAMPYDRRPDRRSGGGRPGGSGRPGERPFGDRAARPPRPPRDFADRAPRDFGDRPPRDRAEFSGPPRPRPSGGYVPRGADEGGMSLRLDPRRLAALKLLAAEAGLRPGELVT